MKRYLVIFLCFLTFNGLCQTTTVHVFVSLCDNKNQGIVPVPSSLGDGQNPNTNLYWGAAYGLKSFLMHKTHSWVFVKSYEPENSEILERVLFKHKTKDAYLLADAYDGAKIKSCIEDFLLASNYQQKQEIRYNEQYLSFGGGSNLVAYIGHDGLMEFDVDLDYRPTSESKEAIILACYSKQYFKSNVKKAGAEPLLWTTHLMAPEAYTLKAALDGWLQDENAVQIEERAAQAYNKYQKCGLKGARNLFTTGF